MGIFDQMIAQQNGPYAPPDPPVTFESAQEPQQAATYAPYQNLMGINLETGQPSQSPTSPKGGGLKAALGGFFKRFMYGASLAGQEFSGTGPTMQSEVNSRNAGADLSRAQAEHVRQQTQQMNTMVTLPNGVQVPFAVYQKAFPEFVKGDYGIQKQQIATQGQKDIATINQGAGVMVDPLIANRIGMPELAGQKVGKGTWTNINAALKSLGDSYKEFDGHQWLVDKFGTKIKDMGVGPSVSKANAFAAAKAEWTPFQTSDANGDPITISAAQAIRTGSPAIQTWNSIFGPTGATKSQAQAAGAVAQHIPDFKASVQNLEAKGELGPVMGRINEYLNKGYGGDDPDIANFVTTVGLLKSGAVRAHFGARGGAQILDKFDNYLNTAQTGAALNGSIDAIDSFLKTYKDVGTPQPPRTNVPPAVKDRMTPKQGGDTLPAQAASQLKEGHITTFANGQQWTLQNGKQKRVK